VAIAPHPDQLDVERINLAVYRAFEALDLPAMLALWVQDDSASCVHPGWEPLSGWGEVRTAWESIFANTESIRFDLSDVNVMVSGSLAVVRLIENIESESGGEITQGRAMATNVFVRSPTGWLIVHHQATPIAAEDGDEGEANTTLH